MKEQGSIRRILLGGAAAVMMEIQQHMGLGRCHFILRQPGIHTLPGQMGAVA